MILLSSPVVSSFTFTDALQVAQIGVGLRGRALLRTLVALPSADVVAVSDESDDALAQAERVAPHARATQDIDAVLSDGTIEAVVIATDMPTRVDLAETALRAGKHVFVERPLAPTVADARRLVTLANQRDRRLMVGHSLRHHPAFRYVESLAEAGTLGGIRYLHSVRSDLGSDRSRGNVFDSLAPNHLAMARALLGEAVAVTAQSGAFLRSGTPDVVFATVEYASGALAHLHCSWLDARTVRRMTVVGERRVAVVDDHEPSETVRVYEKSAEAVPAAGVLDGASPLRSGDIAIPRIPNADPLRAEMDEFVASIRECRAPRTDGVDGLEVVRILAAARQSLAAGAWVQIERHDG